MEGKGEGDRRRIGWGCGGREGIEGDGLWRGSVKGKRRGRMGKGRDVGDRRGGRGKVWDRRGKDGVGEMEGREGMRIGREGLGIGGEGWGWGGR